MVETNTNPTLAEESAAQDAARNAVEPTPLDVPDKFKNADGSTNEQALLKSYKELVNKQSSADPTDSSLNTTDTNAVEEVNTTDEPVTTQDLTIEPDQDAKFDPFFQEFEKDGKLSDASFEALEKLGVSKSLAESYIGSNVQLAERQTEDLIKEVGGKDQFDQMTAWAAGNKSEDDNIAFNKAVQGFDGEAREKAVRDLHTSWKQSNGIVENTIQGQADTTNHGQAPYASNAEFYADMATKQYKTDPAYRHKVHQRAAKMHGIDSKAADALGSR